MLPLKKKKEIFFWRKIIFFVRNEKVFWDIDVFFFFCISQIAIWMLDCMIVDYWNLMGWRCWDFVVLGSWSLGLGMRDCYTFGLRIGICAFGDCNFGDLRLGLLICF